jgi:hypothetical protein
VQVQQAVEWSVKFAGLVSSWWMLPIMLLLALLAGFLYRNQCKGLPGWQKLGLIALRIGILLALVFLAFKPSLIFRRILTYPGRIVMILDDSASMTTRDAAMPDAEALRLARRLGQLPAGPESTLDAMAQNLMGTIATLRTFEGIARTVDRSQDAFWDRAADTRSAMVSVFEQVTREADGMTGLTADEKGRLAVWTASLQELKGRLDLFFSGGRDPGRKAYDDYDQRVTALAQELLTMQASGDDRAIAAGNAVLKTAADTVRAAPRLDLLRTKLARAQPALAKLASGQGLQMVSLMTGSRAEADTFRPDSLRVTDGPTDITGRLKNLLVEPSEFPLTAMILVSDGRNLGDDRVSAVTQEALARQVPVYAAGVGNEREPSDLALVSVRAPSFAVKGVPMRIRVEIRDSMATSEVSRIHLLIGGKSVMEEPITLVPGMQSAALEFTPPESGFFRYTVRLDSLPKEVFPTENNALDFVTHVRDDKVRVLFLDWKPRWETRFALNILQRLPYVDLNSIIALVQEDSKLKRGLQKGTWPETPQALQMYDLVILGDLPRDLLTAAEMDSLRQWVTQRGKTLCVIGSRKAALIGKGSPLADVLFSAAASPSGAVARVVAGNEAAGLNDLVSTAVGRDHFLTRALADAQTAGGPSNFVLAATDGFVLTGAGKTPRPLLAARFAGAGKTLGILDDDLWRLLHPVALNAHTELYANLVTWSLEGGFAAASGGATDLALAVDARRFPPGAPVQVWLRGPAPNGAIEAVRENEILATVSAVAGGNASAPAYATFTNLSPGAVLFRFKDKPEVLSERIEVGSDNRELTRLSKDGRFLRELASSTGARCVEFTDVETCFQTIMPKYRTETFERVWRLWGLGPLLALLALFLTAQWVWRKWVGLV